MSWIGWEIEHMETNGRTALTTRERDISGRVGDMLETLYTLLNTEDLYGGRERIFSRLL